MEVGENKKREFSRLAITSFILVILGLVICNSILIMFPVTNSNTLENGEWIFTIFIVGLVLLIIGLILSIVSLFIIKKNKIKGKTFAILALVISSIYIVLLIVYFYNLLILIGY